jgi:hypothetical protein
MAIKGKKKSQKKGGQAKRRPAAAPRPVVQPRRKPPWYGTMVGRAVALIVLIVVASIAFALIQNARDNAEATEQRQDRLDTYTDEVRAIVQQLRPTLTVMGEIQAPPPKDELKDLQKDATTWLQALGSVQVPQLRPAPGPAEADPSTFFTHSIQLYGTAAQDIAAALASTDAAAQAQNLSSATALRTQAGALWNEGVEALDAIREEEGLSASNLTPPDPAAAEGAAGQPPVPGGGGVPPGLPEDLPIDGGGGGAGGGGGGQGEGSGGGGTNG